MDKPRLQRMLLEAFDIDELKDLAYQIDYSLDHSDGTTIRTHAINIIDHVDKTEKHGKFFLALQDLRPTYTWWPFIAGNDFAKSEPENSNELMNITVQLVRENRNKIMSIDGRLLSLEQTTDKDKKLQLVIMGDDKLGVLSIKDEMKNVRHMVYALLSIQVFIVFVMIFFILWNIIPR